MPSNRRYQNTATGGTGPQQCFLLSHRLCHYGPIHYAAIMRAELVLNGLR